MAARVGAPAMPAATGEVVAERGADRDLVGESMEIIGASDRIGTEWWRRIGANLFDGYFGGDAGLVREKRPAREKSWQALKDRAREEVDWGELRLRRMVYAEVVARELSVDVAAKLVWSQLYRLYSVKDEAVRHELARRIARGEIKGRAAREAIEKAAVKGRKGGRVLGRPAVVIERMITAVETACAKAMGQHVFDPASLAQVRRDKAEEILQRGEKAVALLADSLRKLRKSMY